MPTPSITRGNLAALKQPKDPRFPHMSKTDARVWDAFLKTEAPRFEKVSYDVGVGGKYLDEQGIEPAMHKMWETLVKKRIDAVAWRPGELWIVEVKGVASMAMIGQLITYEYLYKKERGPDRPLRKVCVCNTIDADIDEVCKVVGITVYALKDELIGLPLVGSSLSSTSSGR